MPKKHFLSQSQLENLTSPVRLAIAQRLEIDKEATARELALRMGRPVTSLYHHLKALERAGVLRVVDERKSGRRPEAVYALVAPYLSTAEAVKTRRGKNTYGRAAVRVAEAGARAFSAAMARGAPRFEGESRNAMVRYFVLRADAKRLARLNALLDALEDAALRPSDEGEAVHLTILLSPLPARA
jgi:DNA-binding transcriptional ArsR family regulator